MQGEGSPFIQQRKIDASRSAYLTLKMHPFWAFSGVFQILTTG